MIQVTEPELERHAGPVRSLVPPSKNLPHCTICQIPNLRDLSAGSIAFQKVKVLEGRATRLSASKTSVFVGLRR